MTFYSDFSTYYEQIFPFRQQVFNFLKDHLHANAKRILDIGCGTGHYCGHFAKNGLEVTGIDLDKDMIRTAKKQYPTVDFQVLDMQDINQLDKKFDLIFCIGNVAAHITKRQFEKLIQRLKKNLNDRGVWIFQVKNWDYILSQKSYQFPLIEISRSDLSFYRFYPKISSKRITFETLLKSENKIIFQDTVYLYPVTSDDYLKIHKNTGYDLVGFYNDYVKTPYSKDKDQAGIYVFNL